MKLTKKKIIKILTIIIIIILCGVVLYIYYKDTKQEPNSPKEVVEIIEPIIEEQTETEEVNKIFVDIKGAIKKPGVYEIEENKKVIDVVNIAGGFTDSADTSLINLAKKITDEMVIIIYTKKEIENARKKETISQTFNNTCVCPKIENDACLKEETTTTDKNNTTTTTNEKVNINTATLEQLQTLTGIGESKAKAIIDYREENGNFKSIEELKEVTGIGEALYEKIKNSITI